MIVMIVMLPDLVCFDVRSPAEAQLLDGLEHKVAVRLHLGQVQDNRRRADVVERLADKLRPQRLL